MSSDGLQKLKQIREKYGFNQYGKNNIQCEKQHKTKHKKNQKRSQSSHINKNNLDSFNKTMHMNIGNYNSIHNVALYETGNRCLSPSKYLQRTAQDHLNLQQNNRNSLYSSSILKKKSLSREQNQQQFSYSQHKYKSNDYSLIKNKIYLELDLKSKLETQNSQRLLYDYNEGGCPMQEKRRNINSNLNRTKLSLYQTAPYTLSNGMPWTIDNLSKVQHKIQAYLRR